MMFDEEKHPRDGDGKFTEKGGADAAEKTADAVRKYSDDPARDLKEMGLPPTDLHRLMGEEFKGVKGQAAIDKLMEEKRGHVKAAFHRDDIGDIDLFWGSDTVGLKHIIKRRAEQHINVDKFLGNLAEVIENGEAKRQEERGVFLIRHQEKVAIIAPEYHGAKCTYVLTAYKKSVKNWKAP